MWTGEQQGRQVAQRRTNGEIHGDGHKIQDTCIGSGVMSKEDHGIPLPFSSLGFWVNATTYIEVLDLMDKS